MSLGRRDRGCAEHLLYEHLLYEHLLCAYLLYEYLLYARPPTGNACVSFLTTTVSPGGGQVPSSPFTDEETEAQGRKGIRGHTIHNR